MLSRMQFRRALALVALLVAAAAGPSSARGAYYASLDAGADHTCGIRPGGSVYCWGAGQVGQLGVIGAGRARTPLGVIGSYTAVQLSSGSRYWCEVLVGGKTAQIVQDRKARPPRRSATVVT